MIQSPLSGRYELEEIVGTGGMSVVYRAWDLKDDREVAVKVLRSELDTNENFIRQFNREARAAAQMSNPNIVTMYDVGQDGEVRYLVMEYVRGITLKDYIRQSGGLEPEESVQIALRILAALEHAHAHNIIHRDIKPQNILVALDGQVKVTDFGIAHVVGSASNNNEVNPFGTVQYFSPEQANGNQADAQSDLYSVGVVLYEMLTGKVPFEGETAVSIALKHISEAPKPPSELNAAVSRALDEVILKALEKDKRNRYQTATEMSADLKRALRNPMGGFVNEPATGESQPVGGDDDRPSHAKSIALALIVIALSAALLTGGFFMAQKLATRVRLPSLAMADMDDALAQLEALNLTGSVQTRFDDQVVSGIVIDQAPQAGTLLYPGDEVTLFVSLGREDTLMPDVRGMTRTEAVMAIEQAGLVISDITLEISDDVPPGCVCGQLPQPGSPVTPFADVSLTVSGECANVPPLENLTVNEAFDTLNALGLNLGLVRQESSAEPAGRILSQSVPAGQRLLWGERVDIVISAFEEDLYTENVSIRMDLTDPTNEVYAVLVLDNIEYVVYEGTLSEGTRTLFLALESPLAGLRTLRVYANTIMISEENVDFGADSAAMLSQDVSLTLDLTEASNTVRAVLVDGETEREVYQGVFESGQRTLLLNLFSEREGVMSLRIYVNGELIRDTLVGFEAASN
ncbi:MAG: protein kinase [Clostridia bacterium]|nr:protein kinase [Clostridia bacterium]